MNRRSVVGALPLLALVGIVGFAGYKGFRLAAGYAKELSKKRQQENEERFVADMERTLRESH